MEKVLRKRGRHGNAWGGRKELWKGGIQKEDALAPRWGGGKEGGDKGGRKNQ